MATNDELERDWYFTFGFDHAHPHGYRKIHGTFESARAQMVEWYDRRWAFQYDAEEGARIAARWNLKEVQ